MKSKLGIFEIFFGPTWSMAGRKELATFLAKNNFDFYLYAPKADKNLRKAWRNTWTDSYLIEMSQLSKAFRDKKVEFGVAISPFELNADSAADISNLKEKLKLIGDIGVDTLGLFFDDMRYNEKDLNAQLKTIELADSFTKAEIVFCPTYYSYDPILDKVFGQRPPGYLSQISKEIPENIEILWTGPKVISPEISAEHLNEVSDVLRRKPYICDNFFANDGPKQCKYLKLKPLTGRSQKSFEKASAWAFNPMNQLHLSMQVILAAKNGNAELKVDSILLKNLDEISAEEKLSAIKNLDLNNPADQEIKAWLDGEYNVGSECLTD